MSLSATYDQANAVVELTVDGLATAGATIASIERSTDQLTWTGVRGAINLPVTGDGPDVYLDYEFTPGPGVTNYYRVVSKDGPEFVAVGTADSDENTGADFFVSPGIPVGTQPGDLMVVVVAVNGNIGGVEQPPGNGWALVGQSPGTFGFDDEPARSAIYMKVAEAGDTGPSILIGGFGVSTASAISQVATFRNVRPVLLGANSAREADQPATTNEIEFPALDVAEDFAMAVAFVLSSIVSSSYTPTAGWTLMDDLSYDGGTLFTRVSMAWQYQALGAAGVVPEGVMVAGSGTHDANEKRGWTFAFSYDASNAPTSTLFTDDVDTPLAEVWLKDPLRPARNMVVEVASPVGMRHAARSGLFDIKGRAAPIEVSEIRRTRSWTQRWVFQTFTELDGLLELFSTGRTLLLQVPARGTLPECPPWPRNLPGGYISVGDVAEETAPDTSLPGTLTAPVQIVAAPCADLAVCEPVETSP